MKGETEELEGGDEGEGEDEEGAEIGGGGAGGGPVERGQLRRPLPGHGQRKESHGDEDLPLTLLNHKG